MAVLLQAWNTSEPCTHIAVRLPNGSKVSQQFPLACSLNDVRHWVQCQEEFPLWENDEWLLATAYPRCPLQDFTCTLADAGLHENTILLVQHT